MIMYFFFKIECPGCQPKVGLSYCLSKAHLAYDNQVIVCVNGSLGAQLPHLKDKIRAK